MTIRMVRLVDMSESFMTRRRGKEAYRNLHPMLRPDTTIVLNLDGMPILSMSFLDELVLRLREDNKSDALVFQTEDPLTMSRLERISGVRSIVLRSLNPRGKVERIQPRYPAPFIPNIVKDKSQSRIRRRVGSAPSPPS